MSFCEYGLDTHLSVVGRLMPSHELLHQGTQNIWTHKPKYQYLTIALNNAKQKVYKFKTH